MFSECQKYLIDKLKEAGIKTQVYTSLEKLKSSMESHCGAVFFEEEALVRNGSKRIFLDENNVRKKRRKVFDRDIVFDIAIGEYSQDKAEIIYEKFLTVIDQGIYVNGNYIYLEPEKTDWVDKDDSLLRSKVAVGIKVRFKGGIYKDTNYAKATKVAIDAGKEEIDGNSEE